MTADPCWLCLDRGGIAIHEEWSVKRGRDKPPLWTAHNPTSKTHDVRPCPACGARRAVFLLREIVQPEVFEECSYDHEDQCQVHALDDRPCPHGRARDLLASLGQPKETS